MIARDGPVLVLLAALLGACAAAAPPSPGPGDALVRSVHESEHGFHVELDPAGLAAARGADDGVLRDPVEAARSFRATLGLAPTARFELLERSDEAAEGSGLFHAEVEGRDASRAVRLRLVSEPDERGAPTLWLLNDFRVESP